ncbi:MAG: ABC transporter permease subunit, partial [Chloroflexi bacterium]|nr:ABC transporter permease subunit [Chloroflexota bacterium]
VLLSLYLALHATLHLVREREQGTLKVLFFGPVDSVSYLLGRLCSQSLLYGMAGGVAFLWAVGLGWMTNLLVQPDLLGVLGLGLLTNGAVVVFGLLVGAWGRTARTALIIFALVVLLALLIQFGDQAILQLAAQTQANRQDPLLFLRRALELLNGLLLWLSPFAQMSRGMDALLVGDGGRLLLHTGAIVGQAALYFAGAVWALKRGGP